MELSRPNADALAGLQARDEVMLEDSYQTYDRAAYRQKQLDNLKKRGTSEYDATCKIEEPCTPKATNLGEALDRMFSMMSDAELGISSNEKLSAMGLDPEERVNSKAAVSK